MGSQTDMWKARKLLRTKKDVGQFVLDCYDHEATLANGGKRRVYRVDGEEIGTREMTHALHNRFSRLFAGLDGPGVRSALNSFLRSRGLRARTRTPKAKEAPKKPPSETIELEQCQTHRFTFDDQIFIVKIPYIGTVGMVTATRRRIVDESPDSQSVEECNS